MMCSRNVLVSSERRIILSGKDARFSGGFSFLWPSNRHFTDSYSGAPSKFRGY